MNGGKAVLVAMLALTACLDDFHLSASNLDIGPNPAVPGDTLVASFLVSMIPVQRHTVIVTIDNAEYLRVTSNERPPIPYVITLGDAADLIATYGAGAHVARVEVRAEEKGESARTQSVSFELQQPVP
ncbi:MAG: hypothetical protein ACRENU_07600 [Gemmatimonadaceae bacterium]